MTVNLTSEVAIQLTLAAATNFASLVSDHDPGDGDHVVPGELRRFLANLRLLNGVPFSYLVPDADLLPPESIRFFYVDRDWTDAMVQGVLSVGTITTADRAQLEGVYPNIRDDVDEAERTIRTPQGEERLAGKAGAITGFLLRSRAVSGWPNLHVRAYSRDVLKDDALTTAAESNPERMKVLRMERLAPAVLLVLFDGVPAVVHIEEPRQGIQFGAHRLGPPEVQAAKVHVRDNFTGDLVAPVATMNAGNSVDVPFRPRAPGVIDLVQLKKRLGAKAPNTGPDLEPHEFALQMLRFPYRQVFGDPDNQEGIRIYDIDLFKVSIGLSTWQTSVTEYLSKVNLP